MELSGEETAKFNSLLIDNRCYSRDTSIHAYSAILRAEELVHKVELIKQRQEVLTLRKAQILAKVDVMLERQL